MKTPILIAAAFAAMTAAAAMAPAQAMPPAAAGASQPAEQALVTNVRWDHHPRHHMRRHFGWHHRHHGWDRGHHSGWRHHPHHRHWR